MLSALILFVTHLFAIGHAKNDLANVKKQVVKMKTKIKDLAENSKIIQDGIKTVMCIAEEIGDMAQDAAESVGGMRLSDADNFGKLVGAMQVFNDPEISTCVTANLPVSAKMCASGVIPFASVGDAFGRVLSGIMTVVFQVANDLLTDCATGKCDVDPKDIMVDLTDSVVDFLNIDGITAPGLQFCFGSDLLVAGSETCIDTTVGEVSMLAETVKTFFQTLPFDNFGSLGESLLDFQKGLSVGGVLPFENCMTVDAEAVEVEICTSGGIELFDDADCTDPDTCESKGFEKAKGFIVELFEAVPLRRRGKKKKKNKVNNAVKKAKKAAKAKKKAAKAKAEKAAKKAKEAKKALDNAKKEVTKLTKEVKKKAKEVAKILKRLVGKVKNFANSLKFKKPENIPDIPVDVVEQALDVADVLDNPTSNICIAGSLYAADLKFCVSITMNEDKAKKAILKKVREVNEFIEYVAFALYDFVAELLDNVDDIAKGKLDFVLELPEDALNLFLDVIKNFEDAIDMLPLLKAVGAVGLELCVAGDAMMGAEMCFFGGVPSAKHLSNLAKDIGNGIEKMVEDLVSNIMKCEISDMTEIAKDALGLILQTVTGVFEDPGISICTSGEAGMPKIGPSFEGEVCMSTTINQEKLQKSGGDLIDTLFMLF